MKKIILFLLSILGLIAPKVEAETNFKAYQHIERFGTDEVDGINIGTCWIFSKIDGTNGSVFLGKDSKVHTGSRKRELSKSDDNYNFHKTIIKDKRFSHFLCKYPNLRLYCEWLIPHTLKTYREDAWNKAYVFDVYDDSQHRYLPYETYQPLLEKEGIEYISPLAVIKNPTEERLIGLLEKNVFLIKDGRGVGEGIVIKNYEFRNKFGRTIWAKIVRNEFKEQHGKAMGATEIRESLIEEKIAMDYLSIPLVDKVLANIKNQRGGWKSDYIPQLLGTVYHDFVTEEIWMILRKYKYPRIDFKVLNRFIIQQVKVLKPKLF